MPKFSKTSKDKLTTCHPELQRLFNEIITYVDCTIIDGRRSIDQQAEYVRSGKSKTMNSRHLPQKDGYSHAVDCIACPIEWENQQRNYLFAGYVKGVATALNIDLKIGADWDGDFTTKDQSFHDLPHFELRSINKTEYLSDGPSDDDIDVSLEDIENNILGN